MVVREDWDEVWNMLVPDFARPEESKWRRRIRLQFLQYQDLHRGSRGQNPSKVASVTSFVVTRGPL